MKILQLGFRYEEIYRLAYTSLLLNQEYKQAYTLLVDFEKKYQLNSDDYYNFGYVTMLLQLEKEQKVYLEKSLELNPNNAHALNAIKRFETLTDKEIEKVKDVIQQTFVEN